jgi:hypothetical protein
MHSPTPEHRAFSELLRLTWPSFRGELSNVR